MKKIILASTSLRRQEILSKTGLHFEIVASDYEENLNLKLKPLALAKFLSKGKAETVAQQYHDHLIIGADSFVVLGEKILGKPKNAAQAKEMLDLISGEALSVITGFTIIDSKTGKQISKAVKTKVYIKKLTNKEIDNYIKTKEPLDKAGAFGIQGMGAMIVRKINGDFFSAMGLPLFDLVKVLKEFEVDII